MRKVGLNRLFLHAHDLSFYHPKNETTMRVEAPLDKALSNCLLKLRAAKES
jgi:23S rRNA pseudouridine955/2504/2580 synthase